MADVKKDQERDELFRRIYKIATDLVHAGHVAEWDFKSYVLGTMFYRYISENFTAYINEGEYAAGNKNFDYAKMPDAEAETAREGLVQEKGFSVHPSDQVNFPYGVGICALRKKGKILYLSRIHTPKDTVLEETNVNILRAALITFITCGAAQ